MCLRNQRVNPIFQFRQWRCHLWFPGKMLTKLGFKLRLFKLLKCWTVKLQYGATSVPIDVQAVWRHCVGSDYEKDELSNIFGLTWSLTSCWQVLIVGCRHTGQAALSPRVWYWCMSLMAGMEVVRWFKQYPQLNSALRMSAFIFGWKKGLFT